MEAYCQPYNLVIQTITTISRIHVLLVLVSDLLIKAKR